MIAASRIVAAGAVALVALAGCSSDCPVAAMTYAGPFFEIQSGCALTLVSSTCSAPVVCSPNSCELRQAAVNEKCTINVMSGGKSWVVAVDLTNTPGECGGAESVSATLDGAAVSGHVVSIPATCATDAGADANDASGD